MAEVMNLEKINKYYGIGGIRTQILHNIDLSFEEKSFNSIIGASGSGKTTLMNIMGTLDRPTSGEVSIAGIKTSSMKKEQLADLRNQTIGFVFQFHYLLPEFTARENVLMPHLIKNARPSKEAIARADELLDMMGLDSQKDKLPGNMSGGQQQRTAIARSLINNPKMILADEPTGNLDSDTTEKIYDIFRDINQRYGTTFIVITHDKRIAEKTDRIIEIKDGKITMDIR